MTGLGNTLAIGSSTVRFESQVESELEDCIESPKRSSEWEDIQILAIEATHVACNQALERIRSQVVKTYFYVVPLVGVHSIHLEHFDNPEEDIWRVDMISETAFEFLGLQDQQNHALFGAYF